MLMMFGITSPQRTKIVMLGVALVLVIAATAFGQIRLNAWNQPFYNALQRRDLHGFFGQLVIFCFIAAALLALNVAQAWLNQATKVKLREGTRARSVSPMAEIQARSSRSGQIPQPRRKGIPQQITQSKDVFHACHP